MIFPETPRFCGALCALMVLASQSAVANDEQGTASAKTAIRQAGKEYVEALRRGDAKALAAHWTKDGIYIDAAGRSFNAHELIKQRFEDVVPVDVAERATVDSNSTIRFITPNVAIEEGRSGGASAKHTATWVKREQQWLLARLQDWVATEEERTGPLDALAWMIGDWVANSGGHRITCNAAWSENHKFILRRFAVTEAGRNVLSGTQRIGWDPGARRIRSWSFDSDGGIAEARWQREGDAWIVRSKGVLPDGTKTSSAVFWIREGQHRCVRKTSHVMVADTEVKDSVVEFSKVAIQ